MPRSTGRQQRCLVIGGAGFLGRHLVAQLLDTGGWAVTVFDLRDAVMPGVTVLTGDLRSLDDVTAACKGAASGTCFAVSMCHSGPPSGQPTELYESSLYALEGFHHPHLATTSS